MLREFCPECGNQLQRSHSRGFQEKFVKTLFRHRLYRCHECGWRGWVVTEESRRIPPSLQKIFTVALVVFVTLLIVALATYFIE